VDTESPHDSTSLSAYLGVLKRRQWVVLAAVLLVPAAALFFSLRQTPMYQASAEVFLSKQNLASALTGTPDSTLLLDGQRDVATQANLAQVPEVARRTLAATRTTALTPTELLDAVTVTAKGDSDILEFTVTDSDTARAKKLAAGMARQYTIYRGELDGAALARARSEVTAKLAQLEAQGKEQGALYGSLEEKEQQLATLETLQTARASVVRVPDSAAQVSPKPLRNALLAVFLGLVLGVGLAFAVEALDTRVRSASQISDALGLQLLARLPRPPRRIEKAEELVMLVAPSGPAAEAFRMLRTNLDFACLDATMRTLLVTSAVEREGKSTTAANLAVALARAGKHAVLVDLDLRKPVVERLFRMPTTPGLTDVALGQCSLDRALTDIDLALGAPGTQRTADGERGEGAPGRLQVLAAGPLPPDPGEFIGTHRLSEILFELRHRADIVVIDSPPILRVGDALTLSTKIDGLILVSRLNVVRRPMLAELRRLLDTVPARKLGFVVTGAHTGAAEYGYGYGYGYGYSRPVDAQTTVAPGSEKERVEETA
jgi:succinoglycan biosynthesis transport protein ExoP